MVKLQQITFENDGKKIVYHYEYDAAIAKFFNKQHAFFSEYDTDISQVPLSIAVIPFLANFAPLSWFANFDIEVDETDAGFCQSLANIRKEVTKHHPQIAVNTAQLKTNPVSNTIGGSQSAMLFSGGVDAFTTYFRHFDETPDLVTIQGADIELSDDKQWEEVKSFNENENILRSNHKHYIRTNLRDFYTYEADQLLPSLGWWGNIQHGLALIGALAPLSWIKKYDKIYIASTRSIQMEFNPWGSMPETDEKISWAGLQVIHDGFELKRQDKVDSIVASLKKLQAKTTIRVCYSELKTDLNCSNCEKCVRTMFGIALAGGNPNDYGFTADISLYDKVRTTVSRGFKTAGTQFFWSEILEKTKENTGFFVFSDFEKEKIKIKDLQEVIRKNCENDLVKPGRLKRLKLKIINSNPELFKKYLQFRRKF